MHSRLVALAVVWTVLLAATLAQAGAYLSKEEALAQAFPEATRIDTRTVVVNDEQARQVESRAHAKLETRLVTVHTGMRDDEVLGYAFIDIHTVRTLPEAFLVVVSPDGAVRTLRVLAFYEPEEYLPPSGWLAQFDDERLDPGLRLKGRIHGIAGSTLSARAVTSGVRRSLALFEVLVRADDTASPRQDTVPVSGR